MAISHEALHRHLREAFPEAQIELDDEAGDRDHWHIRVADPGFRGCSLLTQHQRVQAALAPLFATCLHAARITTVVPCPHTVDETAS
jgi:stress-induced morphogen